MIPPDHETTDPVVDMNVWLRRSVAAARRLTYTCGLAWFSLLLWVLYTRPEDLGPQLLLPAIILGSLTIAGGIGWWHAKTHHLHWRADCSLHLQAVTRDAISTVTTTANGRPTVLDGGRR